jgi:alkylresorcinol/alkylpyrone synthase
VVVAGDAANGGAWEVKSGAHASLHPPLSTLHFCSSHSTLFPNSEHVMGWNVGDMGMEVILAPEIPARIARDLKPVVEQLLQPHGLCVCDVKHYIMHPGGARVLDAFDDTFDLRNDEMRFSRQVLRQHGNMSAPTALFVLQRFLDDGVIQPEEYALIGAMGPGFSSEMILVRGSEAVRQ